MKNFYIDNISSSYIGALQLKRYSVTVNILRPRLGR